MADATMFGGVGMRYVALFRGVNVGTQNRVAMADLRALLDGLGLAPSQTCLQSGNAVLTAAAQPEVELAAQIDAAFAARFGFHGHVQLRDAPALAALVDALPFTPEQLAQAEAADPQAEHLYVYFLSLPPQEAQLATVQAAAQAEGDQLVVAGREIYLLTQRSIRLSQTAIRLGRALPHATARNWRTVLRLTAMLREA